MSSIPPSGPGDWRDPYQGRPCVAVTPRDPGVYDVTLLSGASLRDLVEVTATVPNVIYLDHWAVEPGGSDVTLRFRSLPDGVGVGGWVPSGVDDPETAGWTPYQESLHVLLAAGPAGPTGARLRRCLLGCDPRSVVALAELVRERRPVRR